MTMIKIKLVRLGVLGCKGSLFPLVLIISSVDCKEHKGNRYHGPSVGRELGSAKRFPGSKL